MKYIGVYIDYEANEIQYSDKLHTELDSVKYDLNFLICCFMQDNYNIFLSDEYLYIENPLNVKINIVQTLKIKDTELIFIKNGLVIDIYSKKLEKGYLYNKIKEKHVYKFCIIKANDTNIDTTESLPIFCNPASLSVLYNKSNNYKKNASIKSQFKYGTPHYIEEFEEPEEPEEPVEYISQKINCSLNIKDQLLQELKEKLKTRTNKIKTN
jgi:hypothetical protein